MYNIELHMTEREDLLRKDIAQKEYLKDAVRLADLLNGFLFQGEVIIHPEDIREADGQAMFYTKGEGAQKDAVFRNHDILCRVVRGINCIILGVEEQNYIDPSMPLRALEYTVLQYSRQRRHIMKEHKDAKDLAEDEFLSSFSYQDRFRPVMVLIIYFGDKEWAGPRTLHELLDWTDIPREWESLFMDYQMVLLEVQKIRQLGVFQSDLRLLFGVLQNKKDKKNLKQFLDENQKAWDKVPQDFLDLLGELSGTGQARKFIRKQQLLNTSKERGEDAMWPALEEMMQDAREEGREEIRKEMSQMIQEKDIAIQEKDKMIQSLTRQLENLKMSV